MVGFFSIVSQKTFTIVLVISFFIMIMFMIKQEEYQIINIHDVSKTKENGSIQGVIDRGTKNIYLLNENTIKIMSEYDISNEIDLKTSFPDFTKIGKITTYNINDEEPSNWNRRNRVQWTRSNLKGISIASFLLLLTIYCIALLPRYIITIRDKRNNNSLVPFSYKEENEKAKILNFCCEKCQSKQIPQLLKEEYIEGMQFLYIKCVNCNYENKIRLK